MKTRAQILGENLKRIRTEKGISRKELAELINVNEVSFGKYERGEVLPPLDKVFEIANYMKVSVASITGENEFDNEVADIPKLIDDKIFEYRLKHAYKMAGIFLDESNRDKHFDADGHIVIYSPKKIVFENGVFGYKGKLDTIAFKSENDFIDVMEQAEILALQRGIYFNLAFREIVFNEQHYRVLDSGYLDKPLL